MKQGPRRLAAEELRLWRHAMRGTAPSHAQDGLPPPPEAPPAPPPPVQAPAAPAQPVSKHVWLVPAPQAVVSRRASPPGLDAKQYRRLAAGKLGIDGRIDLHGLTQAEAHRRLTLFLGVAQDDRRRCVLVITGKGPGDAGVLKQNVPRWLTSPPNAARVLTFTRAHPRHGGDGALYVLLRRAR